MAKTQTFNGFVKFVGVESAYNTLKASAAGKVIFAEITDITPAQAVTDMTGTGDSKIHEFRIFANGIEYNLTNRAAFNAAVAKLREAASINVAAFEGTGTEGKKQADYLVQAGTLQAALETLAQRVQNNYEAAIVTIDHVAPTTADTVLRYTVNQGGNKIIDIDIPRDQFLKSAEIVYGEYDPQTGFTPVNSEELAYYKTEEHSLSANVKTYIHFVFQVSDEHGYHDEDVYLDASSLIDVYQGLPNQTDAATSAKTADILVHVDDDNKIWAEIKSDSVQIARLDKRIDDLGAAQSLSSLNAGIDVQSAATGTTVELQHATTTVGTGETQYLDIVDESGNKGIRIKEESVEHTIVSDSGSTQLVTEAAVWNTLAWDVYEPAQGE